MSAPDRECISTHCDSHYKESATLYGFEMIFLFPLDHDLNLKQLCQCGLSLNGRHRSCPLLPVATRVKLVAVGDGFIRRQNIDELFDSLLKQWVRRSEEAKHCVEKRAARNKERKCSITILTMLRGAG